MDILRTDRKHKKKRRAIVWTCLALVLCSVCFLLWRLHHPREYVIIKRDGYTIRALVVRPEHKKNASLIILIHEIYGLNDWAERMADELAAQGFIVIAPDLLSGHGPDGAGYSSFASDDDRVRTITDLDPDEVMANLDAVADYGKKRPDTSGKMAIVGFSWGGWKSFAFAAHRKDLSAAFVFYGTGPEDVHNITAPVYGFYGSNDVAVDATIQGTQGAMKAAGKRYEPVTYEGADHAFMRIGDGSGNKSDPNKIARDQAFARLVELLGKMKAPSDQ
jgi:carboxymethylenebutenolidase